MDPSPHDPLPEDRLSQLSPDNREAPLVNIRYSAFVKKARFVLPIAALVMTVVILTWNEAGTRIAPLKKNDVLPASENIQNELVKPVFNSVDDSNQPYTVTADRAVQDRSNPDLVVLENPVATLNKVGGGKVDGDALKGLYEQQAQKLNLSGNVHIRSSDGYTLSSEELRIDLKAQKSYSGQDVTVTGPTGTLTATGLEGDAQRGTMIFTGPAKVILKSEGSLLPQGEKKP